MNYNNTCYINKKAGALIRNDPRSKGHDWGPQLIPEGADRDKQTFRALLLYLEKFDTI